VHLAPCTCLLAHVQPAYDSSCADPSEPALGHHTSPQALPAPIAGPHTDTHCPHAACRCTLPSEGLPSRLPWLAALALSRGRTSGPGTRAQQRAGQQGSSMRSCSYQVGGGKQAG
jgi:hypothetical protein